VTTHWEDIPDLCQQFPTLAVQENIRWVDAGNLVSSGGISAGIDMSLYLVSRLYNRDLAEKTALQMEYDWNEGRVVSE
jgi:transcriptional regulator GlxA family with amidase domain